MDYFFSLSVLKHRKSQHIWHKDEDGKLRRRKYEKIKKRGNNSD